MRALLRAAGTDVAAQCFLNALLRETKDWRYLPATDADALSEIHIPLSQTQALRVPVRYFMKFMKTNIAKMVASVNRMNIITRIIINHGMRYIYACSAPRRR
ncbi:hypothetical protein ABKT64_04250, partial [Enterobacter roggenkampii]